MEESAGQSSIPNASSFCRTEYRAGRRVGYTLFEAADPKNRHVAIVWFYALSASSVIVRNAANSFASYRCSVVCVDRPGIRDSDDLVSTSGTMCYATNPSIERIHEYGEDVVAVLNALGINISWVFAWVIPLLCMLPIDCYWNMNYQIWQVLPSLHPLCRPNARIAGGWLVLALVSHPLFSLVGPTPRCPYRPFFWLRS